MKRFLLLLIAVSLFGCAHVVSQGMRDRAREVPPQALFSNPDAYKGQTVILGGTIIGASNAKEGTYIEVIQKPLDSRGRPQDTDASFGRFLIFHEGYLDTTIYSRGRAVTVAGEIMGTRVRSIDDLPYSYPLIRSRELHLAETGRRSVPVSIGIGIGIFSN
ncbi:MAG: Slp family lipoprotein [Nitrospirota bacterium]